MGMTAIVRRSQASSDTGAAAVEFALLLPLFVMLVFGTISAGFTFNRWIETTQAARETARFGATLPVDNPDLDTWLATLVDVAADSAGISDRSAANRGSYLICVRFVKETGSGPATQGRTEGTLDGQPAGNNCNNSSIADTNRVEVLIRQQSAFEWIFAGSTLTVSGSNTSRYEPAPSTG